MKKPSVTIGIPVYQSEKNIGHLLLSLLKQKAQVIQVKEIIAYCDGCTDASVEKIAEIRKHMKARIKIIAANKNHGYAYSLQQIIKANTSDVLVLLNDDIHIPSHTTIDTLVATLVRDKETMLAGGLVTALPAKTFIGKCIHTSFIARDMVRRTYRNGNSIFTVDGKILALKRQFAKSLTLDSHLTANVDAYIYFVNLTQGGKYAFSELAEVRFRLPETIQDWRNLEARSRKTVALMKRKFGTLVDTEWKIPRALHIISMSKTILRYPLYSIFFKLCINYPFVWTRIKGFKKWKLTKSTKVLYD